MRKFIMTIGLAGIMLLAACGSVPASNEVLAATPTGDVSSPWTEPIQAPPLEERLINFPEFLSASGTISEIEEIGSNLLVRISWTEVVHDDGTARVELPMSINLHIDQDTILLADSEIEIGMFVTAIWRAPTREQQLSPGLTLPAVAISDKAIRVARYDEDWMYINVRLTITDETEIILQDGQPFDGEIDELRGRALVTILGLSGSPVPGAENPVHMQWPSKVVVLFEQAVPPIHHLTGEELIPTPPIGGAVSFDHDMPSSWALEQVRTAMAMGFVPTHLQYNFTQAITRAEFAALAVSLYESINGEITGRTTFADTNDINVQKMGYLGVVSGVGNGYFNPYGAITREQAAVMLSRLIGLFGIGIREVVPPRFYDGPEISSWAILQVRQMQALGIMSGVGNNLFAPQQPYTREQSIITIMRVFDLLNSENGHTSR